VAGAAAGLNTLATGADVSLLAICSALVQPWAGRARDAGRLRDGAGMADGLALAAAGMVLAALVPGVGGVLAAAVGVGVGPTTPLGFAHLAARTPPERLGQTMSAASAANSAIPAARCWSARSPRRPHSVRASSAWPRSWRSPEWSPRRPRTASRTSS
jgi:hypothetical protein